MGPHKYGPKGLQTYKYQGRVYQSSTTLFTLPTALNLSSKIRVIHIGEVEDGFVTNQVHMVLITIVSLDVANTLILAINNGRQLTDVDIQFLD